MSNLEASPSALAYERLDVEEELIRPRGRNSESCERICWKGVGQAERSFCELSTGFPVTGVQAGRSPASHYP